MSQFKESQCKMLFVGLMEFLLIGLVD